MTMSKNGVRSHSDRSLEDLCEPTDPVASLCMPSLLLDANYPSDIDSSKHRLYSRRVSAPKFSSSSLKSKFGCFEKQHSHPPLNAHCDERSSFINDFHAFSAASGTAGGSFESSAKAIADNSCFRVYKMAADGKSTSISSTPILYSQQTSANYGFFCSEKQPKITSSRNC